jgi:phage terminase small subunit
MGREMAQNDRISAKQLAFALAYLETGGVASAARASGVSERQASRYMRDPRVKAALAAMQDERLKAACARVVAAMSGAVGVLVELADDTTAPPAVRTSAARALLDNGVRLAELVGLSERLDRLEEAIR